MTAVPPFVGRARELEVLAAELDHATAGRPRVVWIEGQSGIGKTQLLRRFVERAPSARLIDASGEQGESSLPFGVVDQLWHRLRHVKGGAPGTAFPVTHEGVDPLVMGAELLTAVGSDDEPVILAVDDLQWIDLESARSLLLLLRRIHAEPVLVLLISQPDPALRLGQAWARLLADGERVTHIRLTGLTPEDLIELASRMGQTGLGRGQARRLHGHTQGHPLYARSMLEELGVSGLRSSRTVLPTPRSFAALVEAKVMALPAPAVDLVSAGAVLGRSFPLELATMVGRVDDPVEALEAAVGVGLLDPQLDGRIAFSHPLVQSAVYTGMPPTRRRDLHSAAASITSGATSLGHRVGAATGADAGLADELAALAASEDEAGGHLRAADHLEAAARLADDPSTRERLLLEAVQLMHAGGDLARAEAMAPAVHECAPGPQRTFVLGLMAFAADRVAEADSLLARTVAATDGSVPAPWVTHAASTLALARLQLLDWPGALEAAETALAGDPGWARSASLFSVVMSLDQLERGEEAMARLAAASADLSDDQPGSLDVLAARGQARLSADDLSGAVSDLTAVARRARSGEPIRMHEFALRNLGEACYRLGRWDDALFHADLAISLAADSGRGAALVHAHALAAAIRSGRGRYGEAEDHIRAAEVVTSQSDSLSNRVQVAMARAILAEVREDAAGMLEAIGSPFGGRVGAGLANTGPASFRMLVIEALLGSDRLDQAAAAIDGFDDLVARRGLDSQLADAARLRGLLAEANADQTTAAAVYESALESAVPAPPQTLGQARLAAASGRLCRRTNRRRSAVEQLRMARETFAQLGAAPFVARCDDELSRCGLPTRADATRHPLELTEAETRVAGLVAGGLTNKETASRLYVSPKTVEYHLGHVYTKLGITSRSMLADRLRQLG